MFKHLLTLTAVGALATSVSAADWVDWDRIEHWAGDPAGKNRCALVIDFQDEYGQQSLVWGFRWDGTATGEDLVRAVASQSSVLTAMIQYTGNMGSTLNGFGIAPERQNLDYLTYDFDNAALAGQVSFGYFTPNTSMGQETCPGYDTPDMMTEAIERARTTGVIEHPLNAFVYGYPAYDYDYWKFDADLYALDCRWRSGWYDGYWSYWHGPNDYDMMGYSGLGMSSTVLTDGCVQAWKYISFGGEYYGGELTQDLDYDLKLYEEHMQLPVEKVQPVNQDEVKFWVGTGEKAATVVFQFNDGKGPENLVYGYRWSGGWDDALSTVIENIAKADPRMQYAKSGNNLTITYDADDNGSFSDTRDHNDISDTWNCYVQRVVDDRFNKVSASRWLNPNAVLIVSHQAADVAEVSLPYQLMRPALDDQHGIFLPSKIEYALADQDIQLPFFLQLPDGAAKFNTAFNWTRDTDLSAVTTGTSTTNQMGRFSAYKNFKETTGQLTVRASYTLTGSTKANYITSEPSTVTLLNPVRPVTSLSYPQSQVDARLAHEVDNKLAYEPADATYTKITYKSSKTNIATVNTNTGVVKTTNTAGEAEISAVYAINPDVAASYSLTSSLQVPVADITFDCADDDNVITLTPKEMAGLIPVFTPEDPDIATVTVKISDNGTAKDNYIATMYQVMTWDKNNVMTRFNELSGHREGDCKLTVSSGDGTLTKEFTVRVVDREREPAIDYNTGTIMLNEEWFGHTNGGLNWYSPDYDIVYQAYERENPGMSFGATSCFGIIYDNKLIVSSKQAVDNGDPLPGGGRLVVADASTLKRLGSIDNILVDGESKSADGRGLCGAGPGRAYMATSKGVYIIDLNDVKVVGKIGGIGSAESSNVYANQIGDMLLAGRYAYAVAQSKGLYIIDIDTDEVVKTIEDDKVQGVAQTADGTVWYTTNTGESGNSYFIGLDNNTLEEIARVEVPAECGNINCGWGSWRPTQFTGSHTLNTIFFAGGAAVSNGGSGNIWRYDVDDNRFSHVADVSGLPAHNEGYEQGAYGTIRYDDRNGEIIAGTTEFKASGHYRYNWTHFIDAATGKFNRTVELRPYYWFQAHPIFPDAYAPEFEEISDITMTLEDEPRVIELKATDRDNHDANIRFALADAMAADNADAKVLDVALEGNRLTLTPLALGTHFVNLSVESNGRVVNHTVKVSVDIPGAADDIAAATPAVASHGRDIIFSGCQGARFDIVNALGAVVRVVDVTDDHFIYNSDLAAGIYILVGDNGLSKKLIIK